VRSADFRAQLVIPLSAEKSASVAGVSALKAGGNTALYAAVSESTRAVIGTQVGRRLVILLTDGEEFGNVSGVTRQQSLQAAADSGAIFYVIGLGIAVDRAYLIDLAARTGGRYLDAATASDVESGFAAIEAILKGQFVLSLESSAPAVPRARTLMVRVNQADRSTSTEFRFTSQRPEATIAPVPTVTVTVPVVPAPTESPAALPAGGSRNTLPYVGATLFVLAVAATGVWVARRRRREPPVLNAPDAPGPALAEPALKSIEEYVGYLVETTAASMGASKIPITLEPVTVGWGDDCQVRLARVDGLSALHARLWWRDGRIMLHNLAQAGATTVNDASVEWASLMNGDRITFGPFEYLLHVRASETTNLVPLKPNHTGGASGTNSTLVS